jgi:hypothetical protein
MLELLREAISPPNLLYTILLGMVLLYWLTVLLGAIDLDFLEVDIDTDLDLDVDVDVDVDLDMDVDADVDMDADVDSELDAGGGAGWFMGTLSFFNVGQVPFMIFMTFLILVMWMASVLTNYYWGHQYDWFMPAFLIPNLVVGLFVAKLLTAPFKSSYKKMTQQGISKRELVGKIATARTLLKEGKMGQAELTVNEDHFLISVKLEEGKENIRPNEKALIVEYRPEADFFMVTPFEI